MVEAINKSISFGAASGAIIETTKREIEPDTHQKLTTRKWTIWGKDNNYPQKIIDANMQEGASAGALLFKRKAHYGAGLMYYKKSIEGEKEVITPILFDDLPVEMQDFHFNNDLENFAQGLASDFEWWNMCHVQYLVNRKRDKIVGVNWIRTKDQRPEKRDRNTGKVNKYYLSGHWPMPQQNEVRPISSFDKRHPFKFPNAIYRHSFLSIDKDYFITPEWQSNQRWLTVAAKIPKWINANIDNSVNIKYHVEIPEEYFISLYPETNYESNEKCLEARKAAEEAVKKKIDEVLAGAENASKIFYTKFALDEDGKPMPGWKIHELKNDIKDAAWLNAYGTAAAAICTAHSVPPSLAGLILSNGLGTGSASDVREQFNYYLQLNTVIPRQTTLEWFDIVKRANKWDRSIHLGYKNIILQSMNENKSGFALQSEPNPTTASK